MNDRSKDKITEELNLSLSKLITEFRKYIPIIQTDDYKIKEPYIKMKELFELKPQIILQGPPGTGKTFSAKNIAYNLIFDEIVSEDQTLRKEQLKKLEESEQFKLIQFHPSYSYEDFVRGITAKAVNGIIEYKTENKVLAEFAKDALKNYTDFVKDAEVISREKWIDSKVEEYVLDLEKRILNGEDHLGKSGMFVKYIDMKSKTINVYHDEYASSPYSTQIKFKDLCSIYIQQESLEKIRAASYIPGGYYLKLIQPLLVDFGNFIGEEPSYRDSVKEPINKYILIIDEINRANLSSVLGELIYGLEYRDEPVDSMYEYNDSKKIVLPPNLYIIGTMNTADRSVGHIDYAIRRRFAFKDVLPSQEPIKEFARPLFKSVSELFIKDFNQIDWSNPKPLRSDFIAPDFRPEDVWIGHSYFMTKKDEIEGIKELQLKLEYEILPILKEYVKDGILLDSANEIIKKLNVEIPTK
jgi:hypothetical protein